MGGGIPSDGSVVSEGLGDDRSSILGSGVEHRNDRENFIHEARVDALGSNRLHGLVGGTSAVITGRNGLPMIYGKGTRNGEKGYELLDFIANGTQQDDFTLQHSTLPTIVGFKNPELSSVSEVPHITSGVAITSNDGTLSRLVTSHDNVLREERRLTTRVSMRKFNTSEKQKQ